MSRVIILDSGPLSEVTKPQITPEVLAIGEWLEKLTVLEVRVIVPEIADYEVRRELLRARKTLGLTRLDAVISGLEYLAITTTAMHRAAELWAQARQQGQPTAGNKTLDADMILCAQAQLIDTTDITIATTNIRHLNRFVPAKLWQDIAV